MERVIRVSGVRTDTGEALELKKNEIDYGYRHTNFPESMLILEAGFQLEPDDPDAIQKRMDEMLSQRRSTQPLWERNAGCIFKNPKGDSAGRLIDEAGCKGEEEGAVRVSDVHANFMVNLGGGSAEDVLTLIGRVRKQVREAFDVELETEVKIVGEQGIEKA